MSAYFVEESPVRIVQLISIGLLTLSTTNCVKPSASKSKEAIADEEKDFLSKLNSLETRFDRLPLQSQYQGSVWNGYYWPYKQGGMLAKLFDSKESPLDKLQQLYKKRGKETEFVETFLPWINFKTSWLADDVWAGYCNGMAEAAFVVPVKNKAVSLEGITFHPHEVKALAAMLFVHSEGERYFAGKRAEWHSQRLDPSGRPWDIEDRDTNPGTFHIAMANMEAHQTPLIVDVHQLSTVLNFPVKSFEVLESEVIKDPSIISQMKEFNEKAVKFVKLKSRLTMADSHRVSYEASGVDYDYIQEYQYILELDAEGTILGGEWIEGSIAQHPDFIYTRRFENAPWNKLEITSSPDDVVLSKLGKIVEELTEAKTSGDGDQGLLASHADYLKGDELVASLLPPEPADAPSTLRKLRLSGLASKSDAPQKSSSGSTSSSEASVVVNGSTPSANLTTNTSTPREGAPIYPRCQLDGYRSTHYSLVYQAAPSDKHAMKVSQGTGFSCKEEGSSTSTLPKCAVACPEQKANIKDGFGWCAAVLSFSCHL